MPLKRCILNGRTIKSIDDFYDQLADKLPVPEHFGRNLDALWDVLSTDIKGPFEIVWKDSEASKKVLKRDFERVLQLLKDLEDDRVDFKLKIGK